MNLTPSAGNLRARRRLLIGAAVLAAVATLLAVTYGRGETATGAPGDDSPERFRVVGDGELPTERPPLGAPRDPLSAREVGYAIHLATTDASVPATARNVRGEPGPEVLLTDLAAGVDDERRLAVVHLYDYADGRAYQQTVDIESGKVTSIDSDTLQPPISPAEADEATRIALTAIPTLAFTREFEAAQGVPLLEPDQVAFRAGTFVYDGSTTGGQECTTARCAQLMLQLPSGAYLSTWDFVVNLSDRSIVRTKG